MALTATYDLVNTAGVDQAKADLLVGLCSEALRLWGEKLAGNANVTIRLEIITEQSDQVLADAAPSAGAVVGVDGDTSYWVSSLALRLQGNVIRNPDNEPDITIRVNANALSSVFLDPSPATRDDLPQNKYDGLSIMLHELGHGLGFYGFFDESTGTFFENTKSAFDYRMIGGNPVNGFSGPNSFQFLTNIAITNGNYGHYGQSPGDPREGYILLGLMTGHGAVPGFAYQIGDIDVAILADTGLGTNGNDVLDLPFLPAMRGGPGNDSITGGAGNNRLWGDGGRDLIIGGDGNDRLFGGASRDIMDGGNGNDLLAGGTGADYMAGGAGNDTYIVDSAGDRVVEVEGQTGFFIDPGGTDVVRASVSCDLTRYGWQFIDKVVLTGAAAANVNGNALANTLIGNAAANVLSGGNGQDTLSGGAGDDTLIGGAGRDVLTGGNGADAFLFNLAPVGGQRLELIKDFASAQGDRIVLKLAVFGAAGPAGALDAEAFHAGAGATRGQDASDRIIYDTETGRLAYDPDGDGPLAASGFALLRGAPALAVQDIWLVA
jgi:Ca2+-binding RTX toxin-like protein